MFYGVLRKYSVPKRQRIQSRFSQYSRFSWMSAWESAALRTGSPAVAQERVMKLCFQEVESAFTKAFIETFLSVGK